MKAIDYLLPMPKQKIIIEGFVSGIEQEILIISNK